MDKRGFFKSSRMKSKNNDNNSKRTVIKRAARIIRCEIQFQYVIRYILIQENCMVNANDCIYYRIY